MSVAGSSIFSDADGYQASLQDMLDLVVICPRAFHARLTRVELPHLQLMRAEESSARIAYLRLPPERVFVFFAARQGPSLVHGGKELRFGDLVWHQAGRNHQRTRAGSHWGSIAVASETLLAYGHSIAGLALSVPEHPQILRPAAEDRRELLRLHAQAGRIAETSPQRIINPEVVRALDQELIGLLIGCVETATVAAEEQKDDTDTRLCVQFEELLRTEPSRVLPIQEICDVLKVSQPKLRAACQHLLGMGPGRYQRLRRLKVALSALTQIGVQRSSVPEIMAHYGFADLNGFVTEYSRTYGEMPALPARLPQR